MLEGGKSYTLDVSYGTSGFTEGTYNLYVWVNDARTGRKVAEKTFTGVVKLLAPIQVEITGYDLY
jgi:outer membrane usher protein FimD/PapC